LAPGPKTAALVATLVWFVGYCSANVSNVMYGFMPVSLTVVGTLCGLVELLVAGVRSIVDRSFPLEEAAEAHRYAESGAKKGAVLISLAPWATT